MTIKERLEKLLSEFHDECIEVLDIPSTAGEILELFTQSKIKEKLYQGIIKRELKDRYKESNDNGHFTITCRACNSYDQKGEKIIHDRRCHTAQMERVLAL